MPLIESLSDVIDVHAERVLAGVHARIPTVVCVGLYVVMVMSVAAAGHLSGLAGARTSFAAVAYAAVFASVIVMIAVGAVPRSDQFGASRQSLATLRARLTAR